MSFDMLPVALKLGSSALQAHGSLAEGKAAASMQQAQAQAESDVLRGNAAQVRNASARREEMVRRQGRAAIGRQTAAMAQAGIADAGTGVDVLAQSLTDAETDAMNVGREGLSKSDALLSDARDTLLVGQNQAIAAKKSGKLGAVALLSQGAADAYGIYRKLNPRTTTETEEEKEKAKVKEPKIRPLRQLEEYNPQVVSYWGKR